MTVTPKSDSNETFKDPTSVTLIPTTKPAPPTRLVATSSSSTQIELKWNLPTSDGNDPIIGYQIEVKEGTGEYETWKATQEPQAEPIRIPVLHLR